MNGDIDVIKPIADKSFGLPGLIGKFLFMFFMIMSNWAILAILTSVVSDRLISTSAEVERDDLDHELQARMRCEKRRLLSIFQTVDENSTNYITEAEWKSLLSDQKVSHEMCELAKMKKENLQDLFECFANTQRIDLFDMRRKEKCGITSRRTDEIVCESQNNARFATVKQMDYRTFITCISDESETADKTSILRVMARVRMLEGKIDNRLHAICNYWHVSPHDVS